MSLRQLLRSHLFGPYGKVLWLVVVLQSIQVAASLTLPGLNADIIDNGVLTGNTSYIVRTGVVMLGFTFVQVVFASAAMWYGARAAMGFGRDVRKDLFHRVTDFSAQEVGRFGAPSLITRITNDVQQVQLMVVMGCTMMIAAPLTLVIGVVMALRQDIGLSVVLVVTVPAAVIVLGSIVSRMVPAFQGMQLRIDRVNRVLREQITGIRVVRAFVREPEETARFAEANSELTATALRSGRLMAAMFPTVMLIINLSSVAVLWVGADRIDAGSMQIGSLVAYLSYLIQILMAVVMATFMVSMIPRAAVAAGRIEDVLRTESSVRAAEVPVTEVTGRGTLEFRDVGFHYPGAEHAVLSGISFRIEPGHTTAIIGSTGAGKSTLVNLVPRLFDATSVARSRAENESSKTKISGRTTSARAMASRWRWPPDTLVPPWLMSLSRPSGMARTKSAACAISSACHSSASVASGRP
jgi:ATP-binding cassette, subfamily B, multidrug efflux pump